MFSLNELLELETERVLSEQEQERIALEAELERRRRAEEAERRAQAEDLQRAEEAHRRKELARREAEARLAAIQLAEIEKARQLAENESRLLLLAKQQEHERAILSLNQDRTKKKLRLVALASVSLAILLAIGGTLLLRAAHHQLELDRVKAKEASRRFEEEKARELAILRAQFEKLDRRDKERRREIQKQMDQLETKTPNVPRPGRPVPPRLEERKPPPRPVPKETCLEGDPMCNKDF